MSEFMTAINRLDSLLCTGDKKTANENINDFIEILVLSYEICKGVSGGTYNVPENFSSLLSPGMRKALITSLAAQLTEYASKEIQNLSSKEVKN